MKQKEGSAFPFKYREDEILYELQEYIKDTYSQHYMGEDGVQAQDVYKTQGIEQEVALGAASKYLLRYGKKAGYNREDIVKAVHQLIFLLSYTKDEQCELD